MPLSPAIILPPFPELPVETESARRILHLKIVWRVESGRGRGKIKLGAYAALSLGAYQRHISPEPIMGETYPLPTPGNMASGTFGLGEALIK